MKKRNKRTSIFLAILFWFLALCSVLCVFMVFAWNYLCAPLSADKPDVSCKIRVVQGTSVREVCSVLEENGLIKSADFFYYIIRFNLFREDNDFCLKTGVYSLNNSMSLQDIYIKLQSGEQEYISVSIPEGLTITKIANILQSKNICSAKDFIAVCSSQELMEAYSISADNVEGYLFPDTYFLTPEMNAENVARELIDNFFRKISGIENLKDLNPEKLKHYVILASIIEREYRVASEAPLISSVFTNRLNNNIGLYSCATIEYIITELQGKPHPDRITYDNLKIDSPYNTYKWSGLPPGPISNPGLVALEAACNPAKTKYFYFVLTDPINGAHTFSETFDQHKAAGDVSNFVKK